MRRLRPAFCGAGRGATMIHAPCAVPTASASRPVIATTAWVFGVCWWVSVVGASVTSGFALCPFSLLLFALFCFFLFVFVLPARAALAIFFSDFGWAQWLAREWMCSVTGVLRGGSWGNNGARDLRCSNRSKNAGDNRNNNVGFRCVLVGVGGGRKVPAQRELRTARCGVGNSPAPSVPRGHLTCMSTPRGRGENTRRGPWPVTAVTRTVSAKVTARNVCPAACVRRPAMI